MKAIVAIVAVVLFGCWLVAYNTPAPQSRHLHLSPPAHAYRMPPPRRLPRSTTAVMGLIHPEIEAEVPR